MDDLMIGGPLLGGFDGLLGRMKETTTNKGLASERIFPRKIDGWSEQQQ